MDEANVESHDIPPQQWRHNATVYSGRIQEAMRYNRLRSSDYHIVMTIFHAISQGYTKERWVEEQQQRRATFSRSPSDKEAIASNEKYEQQVLRLKELNLWHW